MKSIVNINEGSREETFLALYKSVGWISCTDKNHWERLPNGSTVELVQE